MTTDNTLKVNIVPSPSSQTTQTTNTPQSVNPMTATTAPQMPTKLHTFSYNGGEETHKSENNQ